MTNIIQKSGVLSWQATNISNAPSNLGVYVLRSATDLSSIIYIGSTDNLQDGLNEHFISGDIPGVLFFDWYVVSSITEASALENKWVAKYSPKYNNI